MSNRTLAILGIVAAVMVILAVVISGVSSGPAERGGGPAYLIQGLDPGRVGKIVVGSGEDAVTLQRRGRLFVVVNKDNYPADTKEINELFKKCLDIKTTGAPYTSNPANHEDLEVTEEKAHSLVRFYSTDANSPLLAGVALGKSAEAGQGTYVRLLPGDKVYLTLDSPWIRDRAIDYVDQDLITVAEKDVNSVTVGVGGETYTLKKDQDDNITLENMPAGKKLKTNEAKSVWRALTDLRFDEVTRNVGGLAFNDHYICRLNDSVVYTLNIAKKDDKTYITCTAEFTGERPKKKRKVESEEELKKKEAKLLAYDRAQAFALKHKGWIYEIPSWKARSLTKKLSDLLEDEKKAEEKSQTKTAPTEQAKQAEPAEPNVPSDQKAESPPADRSEPEDPNTPEPAEPNTAGS